MNKKCRGRPKIDNLEDVQEDLFEQPSKKGRKEQKSRF